MAKLYFRIGADFDKVIKLREEIAKLKKELKNMDSTQSPDTFKKLNIQLGESSKKFDELVTEAAKAGSAIEGDFKRKIFDASQTVNGLSEKITFQRGTIQQLKNELSGLKDKYREALKQGVDTSSLEAKMKSTSAKLREQKGTLFNLTQEQANARLSVKKLRDEYALYKNDGKQVIGTNKGIGLSLGKALGVIGGITALKQLGSEIIRVRGEFQSMQTAIETMVGKDTAGKLIPQIKELAKISPLTLSDMVGAEKMMLGFNIQSDDTIKYLKALSDISMGESGKFNSLTLAFSQMSAAGKLMGQDLNQMINAGFNPLQVIAEKTGKSISTLKDEMSKGAISTEMVQQAFIDATSAGGKFYGMSENASKTINGQISMMQDAWDNALNEIGESSEGFIMSGIQATTSLIQNYETIGKILVGMIATYGIYKTALIANIALTRGWAAATQADAVAKGLQTIATKAQTVAQLALNAVMKANPFVLVATLAAGLISAMWAMSDSTTAAARAQKEYNDIMEKASKREQEHKQKIEELLTAARDESLAILTRQKSLEELRKEYPKIFEKYDVEKLKLEDILKLKQQINEEDSKRSVQGRKEAYSDLKQTIEDQRAIQIVFKKNGFDFKKYSKKEKELYTKYKPYNKSGLKDEIEKNSVLLKKYEKDVLEDNIAAYKANLKNYSKEKLDAELKMAQSSASKRNGFNVGGMMVKGGDLDGIVSSINSTLAEKKSVTTYKQDYETAKKEWEDAKKELSEIEKDKSRFTSKQYEKAKEREETTQESYEKLGGVTGKQKPDGNNLRKEQEKYKLLLDKQNREQARMKIDSQHELEQIEIDGLAEGSEKALRQRKLNHEKEIEQIKREAEDKKLKAIKEAQSVFEANPDNKGKSFDTKKFVKSEPAKMQFAEFDRTAEARVKSENTKYNRGDDFKGLLDEYQDYTDKRLAIEKKYNKDLDTLAEHRREAVKNGDTQQVELIDRSIAQATKDKGMELMGLDYDKLKESPEYVRAFENLKETSSETLNSLLSQLENAKGAAAKVLSPDQLREYTTTIQEIMDELDSRNPFQALSDKKEELAAAEEELAKAQVELENARQTAEAVQGGAQIENGVKSSKFNEKTGKIESTKAYLTEAQALGKVEEKTKNYNKAKDKVIKSDAKVKKSQKEVRSEIDELCHTIDDLGKSIGGPAGEIISLIGSIGSFTLMAMSGVEAAADTSANAISTVEKASVILAIIGAAVQIATKIFDLFGKDTTTENYEKAKEAYESYINILDRVIEKQLKLAETLTGDSANAVYEAAIANIKTQSENAKVLGRMYLNSGSSWKSHSKGYDEVDDMSWEGWNQAANALGMSIDDFKNKMGGRMTGLFDLTDEQLVKLQNDAGIFWSQLDSDTRNYADQIANGVEKVTEVMKQRMTDATLIDVDALRSDFQDLLTDMDADSADFADNFEKYMRNAILNSMLKKDYMERLEEWRKKFYAAMDNGVTEDEYNALKEEGHQLSDEMLAKRNELADMYGWTGEDSSQASTSKGFQAMSQDTGEELNGRFTALQIAGEEIKNQTINQSQSLNILAVKADSILLVNTDIRNIADEIRTIQVNSYLELQEIRENTGAIIKPIKDMAADIAEVKKNTSKL